MKANAEGRRQKAEQDCSVVVFIDIEEVRRRLLAQHAEELAALDRVQAIQARVAGEAYTQFGKAYKELDNGKAARRTETFGEKK